MILNTTKTVEIDGNTYDKLHLSLNMSMSESGKHMVNMKLTPMCVLDTGERLYSEADASLFSCGDTEALGAQVPAIAQSMGVFQTTIQALVNARGY